MAEAPIARLFAALQGGGIAARFVGGCVRDAVLGRPIDDIDLAVDKPPETVMRALEAAGIKVVPTGLKHGTVTAIVNGRRRSSSRPCAATSRPTAAAPSWPSPTTGCEDAGRRDFTFNALYADPDGTMYDPFDGRADLAGRPGALHRRSRHAHRRGSPARAALLPLPCLVRPAAARRRRATRPAAATPPRSAACRASACARNCCARSRRAARADALEAMREAGVLDHWLPEYAGAGAAARPDRARGRARRRCAGWRRSCRRAPMPTAIGKRLKLSTQEALRLEVMLAREPVIDIAGGPRAWRAGLYRLGNGLYIDRLCWRSTRPAIGAPRWRWRAAGRRPNCR